MSNWASALVPVVPNNPSLPPVLCKFTNGETVDNSWLPRSKSFDEIVEILVQRHSVENSENLILEFSYQVEGGEEMKGSIDEFSWDGIAQNAREIHARLRERELPVRKKIREQNVEKEEEKNMKKVEVGRSEKRTKTRLQKKNAAALRLETMIEQGKRCTYCEERDHECFVPERGAFPSKCHYCLYGRKECQFAEDEDGDEKRVHQAVNMSEKSQARIELEENISRGIRCQHCTKADKPCVAYDDKVNRARCILCTEMHLVCRFPSPETDRLSYEEEDDGEISGIGTMIE